MNRVLLSKSIIEEKKYSREDNYYNINIEKENSLISLSNGELSHI